MIEVHHLASTVCTTHRSQRSSNLFRNSLCQNQVQNMTFVRVPASTYSTSLGKLFETSEAAEVDRHQARRNEAYQWIDPKWNLLFWRSQCCRERGVEERVQSHESSPLLQKDNGTWSQNNILLTYEQLKGASNLESRGNGPQLPKIVICRVRFSRGFWRSHGRMWSDWSVHIGSNHLSSCDLEACRAWL